MQVSSERLPRHHQGLVGLEHAMFVVLFGAPGAGKGTQSQRLAKYLAVPHLSTGEMLRAAKAQGTALGLTAARYMDEGRLAPDELVVGIVCQRLEQPDCCRGCLFDGFPRTVEQARLLDEYLSRRRGRVGVVIDIRVEGTELLRRMLERSRVERRIDDTPETIERRLEVFSTQTAPVLDYYHSHGTLEWVDGIGGPDDVFERIRQAVEKHRQICDVC
ncbi:MAG: adenylate kinase [Pirellulales bacterium]